MLRKKAASDGTEQWASIVDCAVYTRNRNFRMMGCSKADKFSVLEPSNRYATAPDAPGSLQSPIQTLRIWEILDFMTNVRAKALIMNSRV